jgi:hypothetical protein
LMNIKWNKTLLFHRALLSFRPFFTIVPRLTR